MDHPLLEFGHLFIFSAHRIVLVDYELFIWIKSWMKTKKKRVKGKQIWCDYVDCQSYRFNLMTELMSLIKIYKAHSH